MAKPEPRILTGAACLLGFLLIPVLMAGCGPGPESRRLLKRLHSNNVVDRLKAIEETQTHADSAVRAELLRLFEDNREPPLIRGQVGISLGRLHEGRSATSAVKQLPESILSIGQPGNSRRLDAYLIGKALATYGPDALPAVSNLLRDPRKEVVAWAIMHHGSYRQSDRALEVLARYMDDRDFIYRRAATFGLSMLAHKRAEELALRHLADPDAEVRYNLAWALLNYGSSLAVRPLEAELAKEKDPLVRQEITRALTLMKSRAGSPASLPARKL